MFDMKDDKSNRAKAILDLSVKLGIQWFYKPLFTCL